MMNYYHGSSRCEALGRYIVANNATVREAAREFGIGKSTVHKDVTERLKRVNIKLYCKVKEMLNENFSVRHIRGGEATKRKYESIKNQNGNNP